MFSVTPFFLVRGGGGGQLESSRWWGGDGWVTRGGSFFPWSWRLRGDARLGGVGGSFCPWPQRTWLCGRRPPRRRRSGRRARTLCPGSSGWGLPGREPPSQVGTAGGVVERRARPGAPGAAGASFAGGCTSRAAPAMAVDTYGLRWVVYVMVREDGDVVCSAWMVLRGMAPRTMYANNRFWYERVHGMALVLGTGRGGWWCYTPVVTCEHSRHGIMHSSMRPHLAYMQVRSGPLGRAPWGPWGMENPYGCNWCSLGTIVQCLLVASGGQGGHHPECLDEGGVRGTLWQDVVAHVGRGAYNP